MALRELFISFNENRPGVVSAVDASLIGVVPLRVPPEAAALFREVQRSGIRLTAFSHWCDPELAVAWLARARAFTPASIDALPTAREQLQAVLDQWTAFGNFWRALNLRPYGWKPFRDACEAAWGKPEAGNVQAGGTWRRDVARAFDAWNRSNGSDLNPSGFVTIGPRPRAEGVEAHGSWRLGRACESIYTGTEDCPAPTGELHRVWMRANGRISGGQVFWPSEVAATFPSAWACGPARQGDTTMVNLTSGPLYQGWRCGAALYDERGGAFSPEESLTNIYKLPPMLWYRDLIAPLIERLHALSPEQVIVAVRMSVAITNAASALALGMSERDIARLNPTVLDEARTEERAQRRKWVGLGSAIYSAASTGLATLIAGTAAATGVGAVVGLFVGAVAVINELFSRFGGIPVARYLDVFGRDEPVLERMVGVDVAGMEAPAAEEQVRGIMPEAPPARRMRFEIALDYLTPGARVAVQWPGTTVWEDVTLPGAWNAAGPPQTMWTLAPREYPVGFSLRMSFPDGTSRTVSAIDPTRDPLFALDPTRLVVGGRPMGAQWVSNGAGDGAVSTPAMPTEISISGLPTDAVVSIDGAVVAGRATPFGSIAFSATVGPHTVRVTPTVGPAREARVTAIAGVGVGLAFGSMVPIGGSPPPVPPPVPPPGGNRGSPSEGRPAETGGVGMAPLVAAGGMLAAGIAAIVAGSKAGGR